MKATKSSRMKEKQIDPQVDVLGRFDIWLAIKYFGKQKEFISKLYKSKQYQHGYGMAMVNVSSWLNQFAQGIDKLESEKVLKRRWKKILNTLGKQEKNK